MNLEQLKADHPELVEAITAEAQSGMTAAVSAAKIEGASAERDRIAAVRSTLIPGHEALIETLAFDGTSSAADAALAIIGAEKQLRIGAASALEEEAPPAVPAAEAPDASAARPTMKRSAFNALTPADQRDAIRSHSIVE